jgi:phosphoribosyl-dephospho-CoA transferase
LPTNAPKVSLGGRSRQEASREELLQKSREERRKRQRQKLEQQASTLIQV